MDNYLFKDKLCDDIWNFVKKDSTILLINTKMTFYEIILKLKNAKNNAIIFDLIDEAFVFMKLRKVEIPYVADRLLMIDDSFGHNEFKYIKALYAVDDEYDNQIDDYYCEEDLI